MIDTQMGVKGLIFKGSDILTLFKSNGESDLPGGKVEFGENQIEALNREITEETGLIVKIQDPIAQWSFIKHTGLRITGVTYLCQYLGGQVLLSDEHSDFFWLPLNNVICFEPVPGLGLKKKIEKLQFYGLRMFIANSN